MEETITIFCTKTLLFIYREDGAPPPDLGHMMRGPSKSPVSYRTTRNKVDDNCPAWALKDPQFQRAMRPWFNPQTGEMETVLTMYEKKSVKGEPQVPSPLTGNLVAVAPPEGKIITPQPAKRGRPPKNAILTGQEDNQAPPPPDNDGAGEPQAIA